MKLSAFKDPLRESRLFRTRALVAGGLAVFLIATIATRLFYLQVVDNAHYTTLSHDNRVDIVPIPPTRGLIYDRNGVVLAENIPTFSLEVVPERVEDMEQTLQEVRKLIEVSDEDLERFRRFLGRKRRFEGIPLRFQLNDTEVARISVNRHRLPGVEIKSRLARHYPLGELAAHVVGYVGRIDARDLQQIDATNYSATTHIGKVGVEKSYDELLHGKVGFQKVEANAQGRILRVLEKTPPEPGQDIYLNIDVNLHRTAQEAFGEEKGALVAMDPQTGAVLSLVSTPGYDPNIFVNGTDQDRRRELSRSSAQPLFNRALRGQYPPGSITKPFIGLAGLELGELHSRDRVFCPGWYTLKDDGRRYRDWKRTGHGITDLDKSIVESCDVFFYDLAHSLGIDQLSEYMHTFGFGSRTGIDLAGEARGLMPSREWKRREHNQSWYPGETLITGIGQGFVLATPIQLAANTAALVTEGRRMRPMVMQGWSDPLTGERHVKPPEPLEPVPVKKPSHWGQIVRAMTRVVHSYRGTARSINEQLEYTMGGKTGTAQVFGLQEDQKYIEEEVVKRLRDHALFVAFAPVDEPRIAIGVVVENGGSGGAVAAPIARQVADAYLGASPPKTPGNHDDG